MSLTSTPATPAETPADERLPWPALIVLGAATLLMVTGEMLPTAVLPAMSAGLGVSESAAGLLVSIWAAVVVVASLPLVRLMRGVPRPLVVAGSLAVFGLAAAATALAPSYLWVVGARTAGAAAVGLLWSTVNAHVADLVPDRFLGRATAVVLGGATFGLVLDTPAGRFVADLAGWRASFWVLAAASLVGAVLVAIVVPDAAPEPAPADGAGPSGGSLRPMALVTGLVALALVGHYGAYTYITRLGEPAAGLLPGGMGGLLLVFGLASALGVVLSGRVRERTGPALVAATASTALGVLALGVLALGVAGGHGAAGLAVVVAWGTASGALPALAQTLILRLAGPGQRTLAGALIPILFNGGIAVGAALASGVVARSGVEGLALPAAALVAVAAAGLVTSPATSLRGGSRRPRR